jgi:hypothetical protein
LQFVLYAYRFGYDTNFFCNIVARNNNLNKEMKKLIFCISITLLFIACGTTKTVVKETANKPAKTVTDFANTITAAELKEALYTYASDEFQGRETGEPGQKMAVEYLKKQYVMLGIPSPLAEGDYFQEVPLVKTGAPIISFKINDQEFKAVDDYVSIAEGENGLTTTDEVVYAGFGIETESFSSYDSIDVKDKIVLIIGGEPKKGSIYTLSGTTTATKWSTRQQYAVKQEVAMAKGAKAILFYDPQIYPFVAKNMSSGGGISLKDDKKSDKLYYLFINTSLAKSINASIDTDTKARIIKTPLSLDYKNNTTDVSSENVVAYIKGSEKPDEIIVISAHLDHEGIIDGKIYNGADDDGSGTVGVLEIAEAFKLAVDNGQTPMRSILFLHVTGEEKGLLGSRYYTDINPIFPLKNTMVNLNIDMIGRSDPKRKSKTKNYVYLIGSDKLSTELHNISEEVNKNCCNIELDYTFNDENDPNRFYYRSDHYNFAKNNIPVIFYFNGTHDDYHQHTDTPDKIEYDLLENRARLVFNTAWELANRDDRIIVDKPTASNE